MNSGFVLIFLLKIFASTQQSTQTQVAKGFNSTECVEKPNEEIVAFHGWPFILDCNDLLEESEKINFTFDQCIILSQNETEQTNQIVLESSSGRTVFIVKLVLNESVCRTKLVTVEVRPLFFSDPWSAMVDDVIQNKSVVYRKYRETELMTLQCVPPSTSSIFPKLVLSSKYQTTWWHARLETNGSISKEGFRNYSEFLDRSVIGKILKYSNEPDGLEIFSAYYFQAGLYGCELRHNNETAYVIYYYVCIKPHLDYNSESSPNVHCPQEMFLSEGKELSIRCGVQTSQNEIKTGELKVLWFKDDEKETICENVYNSSNIMINDGRNKDYSCKVNEFTNLSPMCFTYLPSNDQQQSLGYNKKFDVTLTLKNAYKNQEGNYKVNLFYSKKWSPTVTVNVKVDPVVYIRQTVIILGAILTILLISSFTVIFIWHNRIRIKLFIRRHTGKYDQDSKEYIAILSYVYYENLPETTKSMTKKIVRCIQEKMQEMNYNFYDSHKNFEQGCSVETLLSYLNRSHRMIVILTDAYVDDRWSRFEAQQGFINMLKCRTKLIFIRTPGAKKALSKYTKKEDDFSLELREALNASRNICWNEKMSDSRLKDNLQYALPNLKLKSIDKSEPDTPSLYTSEV